MEFRSTLDTKKKRFAYTGLGALFLIIFILFLPSFFVVSLEPEIAKKEIQLYLARVAVSQYMEGRPAAGTTEPDIPALRKMSEEQQKIKQTQFVSVEIKNPFLYPPFISSRVYIVKVVLREGNEPDVTRYFTISTRNKLVNYYWVDEKSEIWWFLSL